MTNNKEILKTCLKNIAKSGLAACIIFFAVAIIMAAIMEHNSFSERNFAAYILMGVAYFVVLYKLHMNDQLSTYAEHPERFDIIAELRAFIRKEGKFFFLIYGICAVLSEIDLLIPRSTPGRPISFICSFVLNPIWGEIPIPVLRYVLGFAYSAAMVCFLAMLRSKKVYQQDLVEKTKQK